MACIRALQVWSLYCTLLHPHCQPIHFGEYVELCGLVRNAYRWCVNTVQYPQWMRKVSPRRKQVRALQIEIALYSTYACEGP